MTHHRFIGIAILGSLLLSSACATTQRHAVTPLPVRLLSPTPFRVHVRAPGDAAVTSCEVLRISGTVAAVRGDTIEFAAVTSDLLPRGTSDCLQGRAGFVVVSQAPALRTEIGRANNGRSAAMIILLSPVLVLVVIMILLSGSTYT
jgi:hypothetical protein